MENVAANGTLRAEAPVFRPGPPAMPVCRFFLQGCCRAGALCAYAHPPLARDDELRAAIIMPPSSDDTLERGIQGATVRFGGGGKVLSAVLPGDSTRLSGKGVRPADKADVCTVLCSWYNPSRIVWLHYRSRKWANRAVNRFVGRFYGRRVDTQIEAPDRHRATPSTKWSVRLSNVSVEVTEEQLRERLAGVVPDDISMGKPTSVLSHEPSVEFVRTLLTLHGGQAESFEVDANTTGSRTKVFARFQGVKDVQALLELNGQHMTRLGSKIFVEQVVSAKVPILEHLFPVLEDQIRQLRPSNGKEVRISTLHRTQSHNIIVRIYGDNATAVAQVKAQITQLLRGRTILNDNGTALWHPFFSTPTGLETLRNIYDGRTSFIYRDVRKQQLIFYGPATASERTRTSVLEILTRNNSAYIIPIENDNDFDKVFAGEGFRHVIRKFGRNKAVLDISSNPPKVIFTGSPEEHDAVRELFNPPAQEERNKEVPATEQDCSVCYCEAEDPVSPDCGHIYCKDCFSTLCAQVDGHSKPIECCGANDTCETIIPLLKIQHILSYDDLEAFLTTSFEKYIRAHPTEISYCPTPDFPTVYNITKTPNPAPIPCPNCLVTICTHCASPSHEPLTCAESKASDEIISAEEKEAMGIKDCPRCHVPIEKDIGCNHMDCYSCHAHICWVCLAWFEIEGECYDHLRNVHGGIGLDADQEVDIEQLEAMQIAFNQEGEIEGEEEPINNWVEGWDWGGDIF